MSPDQRKRELAEEYNSVRQLIAPVDILALRRRVYSFFGGHHFDHEVELVEELIISPISDTVLPYHIALMALNGGRAVLTEFAH